MARGLYWARAPPSKSFRNAEQLERLGGITVKVIKIKDYYGNYQSVPVSDELYNEWKAMANETQRIYRREVYHRTSRTFQDVEESYFTSEDPVSKQVIEDEQVRRIYEAVAQLAPIQQRRVRMLLDGMSCADISRAENKKYAPVYRSVQKALLHLRDLLAE